MHLVQTFTKNKSLRAHQYVQKELQSPSIFLLAKLKISLLKIHYLEQVVVMSIHHCSLKFIKGAINQPHYHNFLQDFVD